jgi:hypothetical protein
MTEKVKKYMSFGVPSIWYIDYKACESWDCSNGDWMRRGRFEVARTPMYLSLRSSSLRSMTVTSHSG